MHKYNIEIIATYGRMESTLAKETDQKHQRSITMNSSIILLLVIGAIALLLYIREKIRAYTLKAVFLKTFVSVCFIAVAVCGWYASSASYGLLSFGIFIVLGLLFGLLGDIWLDLKYVYPAQDDPFTYAGFASFAIGHVLFISGMLLRYHPTNVLYVILPFVLATLVSAGNILLDSSSAGISHV